MKKEDMTNQDLFDTKHTVAKLLFEQTTYPWEILPKISEFIVSLGERFQKMNMFMWEKQYGFISL